MPNKPKKSKQNFWNIHVFVLAFLITFIFSFFIGIFVSPVRIQVFGEDQWYYINRGYPTSWAGVSKVHLPVEPPIVKAPFISAEIMGDTYHKIIDLRVFLPFFLAVLLFAYPLTFAVYKFIEESRYSHIVLKVLYVGLTLACIFFYFFWFPRI
jgi:hypothetical protein